MKQLVGPLVGMIAVAAAGVALADDTALLDYDFRRLASEETINLKDEFSGDVVLLVNTASKCGNTPQYDGLEKLYQEYGERGFTVVGVPSNDFLGQEPGTEEEIQEFCRLTYKVKFPMLEKTGVKKGRAHPMFDALAAESGTHPTWNFHKFLIGRDGKLIAEFSPRTKPYDDKVVAAIESALDAS
ncbi:MAG: glutathione peroxidase [Pseudomonadota bacterium]